MHFGKWVAVWTYFGQHLGRYLLYEHWADISGTESFFAYLGSGMQILRARTSQTAVCNQLCGCMHQLRLRSWTTNGCWSPIIHMTVPKRDILHYILPKHVARGDILPKRRRVVRQWVWHIYRARRDICAHHIRDTADISAECELWLAVLCGLHF